jgi:adhesin transport system membrane fusion protein
MTPVVDSELEARDTDAAVGAATRAFLWLSVALVVGFLAWAAIGRLDIVAVAVGEVIPSTQLKSIQHLEGGIVQAIRVREGEKVRAGQPLVELEQTQSDADVRELQVRIKTLRAEIARLDAEAGGQAAPAFPGDLSDKEPDLIRQQTDLFATRQSRLASALKAQRELIAQREQEIKEITTRIATDRENLKFLREQIKISEELLKDDLTNRMLHLNLLKEEAATRGRIQENTEAKRRVEAALIEARARHDGILHSQRAEAGQELEDKRRSLNEFQSRLGKFQDSLQRTVLRAPVDGVVKTLYVTTIGGVVKPGGTVLDIVPGGDKLVIEARLPTQDIGYVHPGQPATVKLASADAIRFGNLDGRVVQVSPDTLQTAQGASFYKVRIETERDFFEQRALRYQLVPGVQVVCNILTGQRTVLEYLLDPFLAASRTALRER